MRFPLTAPVVTSGYLLDYLWGIAAVAMLYAAPLGAAWRLLRGLLGGAVPLWLRLPLALALSPMLLALVLLAAGLAGVLVTPVVAGVLIVFLVFHRGQTADLLAASRAILTRFRRASLWAQLLAALCAACILVMLISALSPPVEWDAVTKYGHLRLAVMYAEHGALPIARGNHNFGAPHLYHMLLTALYLLRAPAGPPFLVVSQTVVLAAMIAGFAALWWGMEGGLVSAVLLLGSGVMGGLGYVIRTDVPATLLGVTSVLLWARWLERPERRLLLGSSLFAGLAAATKITWCMFLPVQLLLVLLGRRAMTLRERVRETLVYAVLPVVLITPWVVRSQLLTGTPVYPLTWRYTGGKYWDEGQDQWYRAFFHDWCTYQHPTLSVAPGRVPRTLAGMLRRDWPLSATAGLCAVAALSRVAVGGPVAPLLFAALLNFLVIGGFVSTSLAHLLAVFVLGAVVAGSPFAGGGAGRLGKVGRFGVVFVVLLSAVIGRSGELWIVPKFVLGAGRGPVAVARKVGLTHPYGECQLWVNNHSPGNARVLLLAELNADVYLRREQVPVPSLVGDGKSWAQLPSRLDEQRVDYLIFSPKRPTDPDPWWVGTWSEKHKKKNEREVLTPLRLALTAEVRRADRWRLVFRSGRWVVYQRVKQPVSAKLG